MNAIMKNKNIKNIIFNNDEVGIGFQWLKHGDIIENKKLSPVQKEAILDLLYSKDIYIIYLMVNNKKLYIQ